MKKKPILERLGDFMEGKGFYIVLFLCVAAIGISGYYLFSSLDLGGGDVAVAAPTQVVVTPAPTVQAVKPSVNPAPSPSVRPSAAPEPSSTPTPTPEATPAPETTPTVSIFVWPVRGQVVADWSLEVLAYDETMGDWRTHSGVDIAAPVGTQVMATAAGTVASVEQDDLMGTTVTIAHAEGLTSIYANLGEVPTVEAGDHVNAGDIIGAIGTTAVAESARAPHLHFEMELDGNSVDPVSYLPEQ